MTITFSERLASGFKAGKRLSVGIDPHNELLKNWSLPIDASGAESFGRTIVESAAESALVLKPQIAFFERFGSAGFIALERVLEDARQANIAVIADVKRGDIGSTFDAYAEAWLSPGSPLEADAMTVHAYQGFGTLNRAFELALEHGKGVFVLAATSNPEAREVQKSRTIHGKMIAADMVDKAIEFNRLNQPNATVGSVGVVLGATLDFVDFEIDVTTHDIAFNDLPSLPVLAPGFGFQGAQLSEIKTKFGFLSAGLIVHESRSLLQDGPLQLSERILEHSMKIGDMI